MASQQQCVKVSAHGLIKKDNKFLFTRRPVNDDFMPMFWDTPGGTIEFGEKVTDALAREIQEEANLTVKIGKIIFCYDHLSNPKRHQFTLVYECEYLDGEVKLDPLEHDDFKWASFEEIKDLSKIPFLEELVKYLQK